MIIDEYFPEKGKLVLTANGKEFVERIGIETARQAILEVLRGENIRTQTEPMTRRRVAIATGAIIYMFAKAWSEKDNFTEIMSELAIEQMTAISQSQKDVFWPAQWLLGLTGKSIQNVLRSDEGHRTRYIKDFEAAVEDAAKRCKEDFGEISMSLGYVINGENRKNIKPLTWKDITRLSTAIGAATLTIRGSEKSTYGKLFERLIMGAVLNILGFRHVANARSGRIKKVFWLSDSSDLRECDATIRIKMGRLARFDIGFIGRGNPEIMKDKLTRYARELEQGGAIVYSHNFIIVDKMPDTSRTAEAALRARTEIIQMSMQYWPLELANKLKERLGYEAEILDVPKNKISEYLEAKLKPINILDFLRSASEAEAFRVREEEGEYAAEEEEADD